MKKLARAGSSSSRPSVRRTRPAIRRHRPPASKAHTAQGVRKVTLSFARRHLDELVTNAIAGQPVFVKLRWGGRSHGALLTRATGDNAPIAEPQPSEAFIEDAAPVRRISLEALRAEVLARTWRGPPESQGGSE